MITTALVVLAASAITATAQHDMHAGHGAPSGPEAAIAACVGHQETALAALAAADRLAEAARQQNSPARMRAEADELQNLIADAREHVRRCMAVLGGHQEHGHQGDGHAGDEEQGHEEQGHGHQGHEEQGHEEHHHMRPHGP